MEGMIEFDELPPYNKLSARSGYSDFALQKLSARSEEIRACWGSHLSPRASGLNVDDDFDRAPPSYRSYKSQEENTEGRLPNYADLPDEDVESLPSYREELDTERDPFEGLQGDAGDECEAPGDLDHADEDSTAGSSNEGQRQTIATDLPAYSIARARKDSGSDRTNQGRVKPMAKTRQPQPNKSQQQQQARSQRASPSEARVATSIKASSNKGPRFSASQVSQPRKSYSSGKTPAELKTAKQTRVTTSASEGTCRSRIAKHVDSTATQARTSADESRITAAGNSKKNRKLSASEYKYSWRDTEQKKNSLESPQHKGKVDSTKLNARTTTHVDSRAKQKAYMRTNKAALHDHSRQLVDAEFFEKEGLKEAEASSKNWSYEHLRYAHARDRHTRETESDAAPARSQSRQSRNMHIMQMFAGDTTEGRIDNYEDEDGTREAENSSSVQGHVVHGQGRRKSSDDPVESQQLFLWEDKSHPRRQPDMAEIYPADMVRMEENEEWEEICAGVRPRPSSPFSVHPRPHSPRMQENDAQAFAEPPEDELHIVGEGIEQVRTGGRRRRSTTMCLSDSEEECADDLEFRNRRAQRKKETHDRLASFQVMEQRLLRERRRLKDQFVQQRAAGQTVSATEARLLHEMSRATAQIRQARLEVLRTELIKRSRGDMLWESLRQRSGEQRRERQQRKWEQVASATVLNMQQAVREMQLEAKRIEAAAQKDHEDLSVHLRKKIVNPKSVKGAYLGPGPLPSAAVGPLTGSKSPRQNARRGCRGESIHGDTEATRESSHWEMSRY